MKHYKSIIKKYYDMILKGNTDNRSLFIFKLENDYLFLKDKYHIIKNVKIMIWQCNIYIAIMMI